MFYSNNNKMTISKEQNLVLIKSKHVDSPEIYEDNEK